MMIVASVAIFFIPLLPLLVGEYSGKATDFIWTSIFLGGISGAATYGIVTSKITTSPEGVETISFGVRIKASWDKVERVDINPYGFVNLIFKESLYKNRFVNAFLRPLGYDRSIQLSPYIDDLATDTMLKDIANYVPNSNIEEFISKNKSSTKSFQKVGTIGLYYMGFLFLLIFLAFAFRKGAEYFTTEGFQNTFVVSYLVTTSFMLSLFFNGMSLIDYNAKISKLQHKEISRKARTYYLAPFVTLFISLVGGFMIWAILQSRSILAEREENYFIVAVLIGATSLRVSGMIEGLIFKDDEF